MRHLLVAIAVLVPLLTVVPSANATHWCEESEVIEVAGMFYIVIDELLGEEYLASWWIYCESNGIPGLQRGGLDLLGEPDLCQTHVDPDSCRWFL